MQIYEEDIEYARTQPAVQATFEQVSRRLLTRAG